MREIIIIEKQERTIKVDGHSFVGKKFWIVRIDPGEDVLISIKKFIKDNNIEQGVVVMGYGTFAKVSLHWVRDNKFPAGNKYDNWEGGIELMSLNGMIVDGAPHIHFTASDPNGAFGGHMEEGCICYVLCEVAIVELEGVHMTRESVPIVKDSEGNPVNLTQLKFS